MYLGRYRRANCINNSALTEAMSGLLLNEIKYFMSTVENI